MGVDAYPEWVLIGKLISFEYYGSLPYGCLVPCRPMHACSQVHIDWPCASINPVAADIASRYLLCLNIAHYRYMYSGSYMLLPCYSGPLAPDIILYNF